MVRSGGVVCSSGDTIEAYSIVIRESNHTVKRDHDPAAFVFSVVLLRGADYLRRLCLREVVILSQIP